MDWSTETVSLPEVHDALRCCLEDLRLLGDLFSSRRVWPSAQTQTLIHRNTLGRFACARSQQLDGPDLHVSGVGAVAVPLAQSVRDRLRQTCQQKD